MFDLQDTTPHTTDPSTSHVILYDPKSPRHTSPFGNDDDMCSTDNVAKEEASDTFGLGDNIVNLLRNVPVDSETFSDREEEPMEDNDDDANNDCGYDETASVLSTDGNRMLCHPSEDFEHIRRSSGSYGFTPADATIRGDVTNLSGRVCQESVHDVTDPYDVTPSTRIDSYHSGDSRVDQCSDQVDDAQLMKAEQVQEDYCDQKPKLLGRGTFGDVYLFYEDGEPMCVKNMKVGI